MFMFPFAQRAEGELSLSRADKPDLLSALIHLESVYDYELDKARRTGQHADAFGALPFVPTWIAQTYARA